MKATLIAVAALLVVAGVALALMLTKTDAPAPPRIAVQPAGSAVGHPPPTGAPVATPTLPAAASDDAPAPAPTVREYMVGDVKVRDHRTGEHAQMDLPPNMHPANGPSLPSAITHDISQQVKQQMVQCAAALSRDVRGAKPKVDGQLQVAIKDHVLAIKSIDLQVRDITDAAASDALRQCVTEKSAALTAKAPDQADVADYGIGVTFAIP